MNDLSTIQLKTAYHKGRDNIASEFLVPCIRTAVRYDRAVGYFSSAIYTLVWSGLRQFVDNGGKMRLVCSPILRSDDISALAEGYAARDDSELAEALRQEFHRLMSNSETRDAAKALASLIADEILDVKVALVSHVRDALADRLFHDKVGVFADAVGNRVVFRGSMNETWRGLANDGNLESIDVFVSWAGGREEQRTTEEGEYFEDLWTGVYPQVETRPIPQALRDEILTVATKNAWREMAARLEREFEADLGETTDNKKRQLRSHQKNALDTWIANSRRGIVKHATGAGKTRTALAAADTCMKLSQTPLFIVPSEELLWQWRREVQEYFSTDEVPILLCGAGQGSWRSDNLLRRWTKASSTPRAVIAVAATASSEDFLDNLATDAQICLIADEVHRLGAPSYQRILRIEAQSRLGLSATPERAGDPVGTRVIFEYFGGVLPCIYSLKDAITDRVLVPYMYHVHTVSLSEEEQQKWNNLTRRISQILARASDDADGVEYNKVKKLAIERAGIAKQAAAKPKAAADVVAENYEDGQRWLVYCDSEIQMRDVVGALNGRGIHATVFYSAMEGDRSQTLRMFETHGGVVVSIRCLDEGVDIPSATHALIAASSKNPREFIQRRGRVLRRDGKRKVMAFIHDLIVTPVQTTPEDAQGTNLLLSEIARAIEFGRTAENVGVIADLQRLCVRFGVDPIQIAREGVEDE